MKNSEEYTNFTIDELHQLVVDTTQKVTRVHELLRSITAMEPEQAKRSPELFAKMHEWIGCLHMADGNLLRARKEYERSIELDPQASVYYGLALTTPLVDDTSWSKQLEYLAAAEALSPQGELADAVRVTKAECLGALGRWAEAWPLYEARHNVPWVKALSGYLGSKFPRWEGQQLAGETVLVLHEGGIGDTFQMVRYLPEIKALGGEPVLQAVPALVEFLEQVQPYKVVSTAWEHFKADYSIPMWSLLNVFHVTQQNVRALVPYLHPRPVLRENFSFRVGVCWAGTSKNPTNERRSMEFKDIQSLLSIPWVRWVSLQQGEDGGLEVFSLKVWFDTVKVMQTCDLVITIDTSIAHLAGALGLPVWMMLSTGPDYRWMSQGSTTPWYPTMTLFRQSTPGDWDKVVQDVTKSLQESPWSP